MIIELSKDELARVAQWGTQRTQENKNVNDIADYRKEAFNLTSEQANRLGVMVEYAVYKHLGFDTQSIDLDVWAPFVPMSQYTKYLGKPDINNKIEVRRANSIANPIPLRSKDVASGAFVVQGMVNYLQSDRMGKIKVSNKVRLLGWADAVEDYAGGEVPWWSQDGTARTVSRRPMETLTEALAEAGEVW